MNMAIPMRKARSCSALPFGGASGSDFGGILAQEEGIMGQPGEHGLLPSDSFVVMPGMVTMRPSRSCSDLYSLEEVWQEKEEQFLQAKDQADAALQNVLTEAIQLRERLDQADPLIFQKICDLRVKVKNFHVSKSNCMYAMSKIGSLLSEFEVMAARPWPITDVPNYFDRALYCISAVSRIAASAGFNAGGSGVTLQSSNIGSCPSTPSHATPSSRKARSLLPTPISGSRGDTPSDHKFPPSRAALSAVIREGQELNGSESDNEAEEHDPSVMSPSHVKIMQDKNKDKKGVFGRLMRWVLKKIDSDTEMSDVESGTNPQTIAQDQGFEGQLPVSRDEIHAGMKERVKNNKLPKRQSRRGSKKFSPKADIITSGAVSSPSGMMPSPTQTNFETGDTAESDIPKVTRLQQRLKKRFRSKAAQREGTNDNAAAQVASSSSTPAHPVLSVQSPVTGFQSPLTTGSAKLTPLVGSGRLAERSPEFPGLMDPKQLTKLALQRRLGVERESFDLSEQLPDTSTLIQTNERIAKTVQDLYGEMRKVAWTVAGLSPADIPLPGDSSSLNTSVNGVVRVAWVYKQGRNHDWKVRFAVLTSTAISFFREAKCEKLTATVCLDSKTGVEGPSMPPADLDLGTPSPHIRLQDGSGYQLIIKSRKRVQPIILSNHQEGMLWSESISKVCNNVSQPAYESKQYQAQQHLLRNFERAIEVGRKGAAIGVHSNAVGEGVGKVRNVLRRLEPLFGHMQEYSDGHAHLTVLQAILLEKMAILKRRVFRLRSRSHSASARSSPARTPSENNSPAAGEEGLEDPGPAQGSSQPSDHKPILHFSLASHQGENGPLPRFASGSVTDESSNADPESSVERKNSDSSVIFQHAHGHQSVPSDEYDEDGRPFANRKSSRRGSLVSTVASQVSASSVMSDEMWADEQLMPLRRKSSFGSAGSSGPKDDNYMPPLVRQQSTGSMESADGQETLSSQLQEELAVTDSAQLEQLTQNMQRRGSQSPELSAAAKAGLVSSINSSADQNSFASENEVHSESGNIEISDAVPVPNRKRRSQSDASILFSPGTQQLEGGFAAHGSQDGQRVQPDGTMPRLSMSPTGGDLIVGSSPSGITPTGDTPRSSAFAPPSGQPAPANKEPAEFPIPRLTRAFSMSDAEHRNHQFAKSLPSHQNWRHPGPKSPVEESPLMIDDEENIARSSPASGTHLAHRASPAVHIPSGGLHSPPPLPDDASHSVAPISRRRKRQSSGSWRTLTVKDFEVVKPISKGAFGSVFLAKRCDTGQLVAIKVVKKESLRRKNDFQYIKAEKTIMSSVDCPFVVKLLASFQTKQNLYLVMEYVQGGDIYSLLQNLGRLREDWVRQYSSELVLAMEYLHSKGIVHRDLKPDNMLISADGHIKLTDFGLSMMGLADQNMPGSGNAAVNIGLATPSIRARVSPAAMVATPMLQRTRSASVATPFRTLNPRSSPMSFDESPSASSPTAVATRASIGGEGHTFSTPVSSAMSSHPGLLSPPSTVYSSSALHSASASAARQSTAFMAFGDDGGEALHPRARHTRQPPPQIPQAKRPVQPPSLVLSSPDDSALFARRASKRDRRDSLTFGHVHSAPQPVGGILGWVDGPAQIDPSAGQQQLIGTPEYLAPEVLLGKPHGKATDWFALGCIIYEMVTGTTPFFDESFENLFSNITNCRLPSDFDECGSEELRDLVKGLLRKDPDLRLGSGPNGFKQVKAHPFFRGVKWRTLLHDPAPFVPVLDDQEDLSYFDPHLERHPSIVNLHASSDSDVSLDDSFADGDNDYDAGDGNGGKISIGTAFGHGGVHPADLNSNMSMGSRPLGRNWQNLHPQQQSQRQHHIPNFVRDFSYTDASFLTKNPAR